VPDTGVLDIDDDEPITDWVVEEDGEWNNLGAYNFLVLTYAEAVEEVRRRCIEDFWEYNSDLESFLANRQDIVDVIDVEKWAENQVLILQTSVKGGLGSELASYDEEEHEVIIDGKAMFIYATG